MQKFLEADGGNPNGTAKDAITGVQSGTKYLSKYYNDNIFNLFEFVIGEGYQLIADDLTQLKKAFRAKYDNTATYNTSAIATQTVSDIVLGSDGIYYECLADATSGDNPVGSVTGNWEIYGFIPSATGKKNLIINGQKLIQQRGVTGGTKQVVLDTRNAGGSHTISFTGTATVTIKEATTLGASDALTTWDTALITGATSGTTVTLTANKYIHVEFSTTDFDFAQLELGSVATNYAILEDTINECTPYYFEGTVRSDFYINGTFNSRTAVIFPSKMIQTPIGLILTNSCLNVTPDANVITDESISIGGTTNATGNTRISATFSANAEIFNADDGVGINYKEDRWYV